MSGGERTGMSVLRKQCWRCAVEWKQCCLSVWGPVFVYSPVVIPFSRIILSAYYDSTKKTPKHHFFPLHKASKIYPLILSSVLFLSSLYKVSINTSLIVGTI